MEGKSLLSMTTSGLFTYMPVRMKTISVNKRLCMHQLRKWKGMPRLKAERKGKWRCFGIELQVRKLVEVVSKHFVNAGVCGSSTFH